MRSTVILTREQRAAAIAYPTVGLLLLVAGLLFRSAVLNWVVGPMTVVVGVTAVSAALQRRRSAR